MKHGTEKNNKISIKEERVTAEPEENYISWKELPYSNETKCKGILTGAGRT